MNKKVVIFTALIIGIILLSAFVTMHSLEPNQSATNRVVNNEEEANQQAIAPSVTIERELNVTEVVLDSGASAKWNSEVVVSGMTEGTELTTGVELPITVTVGNRNVVGGVVIEVDGNSIYYSVENYSKPGFENSTGYSGLISPSLFKYIPGKHQVVMYITDKAGKVVFIKTLNFTYKAAE